MSDLESVKKLRSTTGAGFKDCNSALKEASGDLEKAIEILRIKGVSKASKKMSREANEGIIYIFGDEKKTSSLISFFSITIGFEAAICIEICFPNCSISLELCSNSKLTTTPSLDKLSLTIE